MLFFRMGNRANVTSFTMDVIIATIFRQRRHNFPTMRLLKRSNLSTRLHRRVSKSNVYVATLLMTLLHRLQDSRPFNGIASVMVAMVVHHLHIHKTLRLFKRLTRPTRAHPILRTMISGFPHPCVFEGFKAITISSSRYLTRFRHRRKLFDFLISVTIHLPFTIVSNGSRSFQYLRPLQRLPRRMEIFLRRPIHRRIIRVCQRQLRGLKIYSRIFSFNQASDHVRGLVKVRPNKGGQRIVFHRLTMMYHDLRAKQRSNVNGHTRCFRPIRRPMVRLLDLCLGKSVSRSGPHFRSNIYPTIHMVQIMGVTTRNRMYRLHVPGTFECRNRGIRVPTSISSSHFYRFSNGRYFKGNHSVLQFFTRNMIASYSQAMHLQGVTRLRTIPTLHTTHSSSFCASKYRRASQGVTRRLCFLTFSNYFRSLFHRRIFQRPFCNQCSIVIPRAISFWN